MRSELDRVAAVARVMARHPRAEYFRARLAAAAPIEHQPSPARQPSPSVVAVERGAAGFAATSPAETGGALLPSPDDMGGPPVHPALLQYTSEALVDLGRHMAQYGIVDIETGMKEFERLHPPPEPVAGSRTNWNFFEQRDKGADSTAYRMLLKGDDEGFLRQAIPAAIESVRGR
jgi:hypothetical protein